MPRCWLSWSVRFAGFVAACLWGAFAQSLLTPCGVISSLSPRCDVENKFVGEHGERILFPQSEFLTENQRRAHVDSSCKHLEVKAAVDNNDAPDAKHECQSAVFALVPLVTKVLERPYGWCRRP